MEYSSSFTLMVPREWNNSLLHDMLQKYIDENVFSTALTQSVDENYYDRVIVDELKKLSYDYKAEIGVKTYIVSRFSNTITWKKSGLLGNMMFGHNVNIEKSGDDLHLRVEGDNAYIVVRNYFMEPLHVQSVVGDELWLDPRTIHIFRITKQ